MPIDAARASGASSRWRSMPTVVVLPFVPVTPTSRSRRAGKSEERRGGDGGGAARIASPRATGSVVRDGSSTSAADGAGGRRGGEVVVAVALGAAHGQEERSGAHPRGCRRTSTSPRPAASPCTRHQQAGVAQRVGDRRAGRSASRRHHRARWCPRRPSLPAAGLVVPGAPATSCTRKPARCSARTACRSGEPADVGHGARRGRRHRAAAAAREAARRRASLPRCPRRLARRVRRRDRVARSSPRRRARAACAPRVERPLAARWRRASRDRARRCARRAPLRARPWSRARP